MNSLSYNKRLVFVAGFYGIFLFGISIITLGSTLPQLTLQYGLTELNKGTLASVLPAGILIGSLVFGPVVDRYSYRYLLAVSVLLMAAGFELIAFAGAFYQLGIAFFFIGFGGGMINGATSSMVSDFSDDAGENKGANLSLLGVFFGLGSLGMPVLLGSLEEWFNYSQILTGLGVAMCLPVSFLLLIGYPAPKQAQGITMSNIALLVKDKLLILMSFILFFQSGWESLVNNWTTTFLINVRGFEEKTALFYLTIFVITFTAGRFALGFLLKKYPPRTVLYVSIISALTGGIILGIFSREIMIIIALVITGFGLAAAFPVILGLVGDRFSKWSGTAFGIALTIALTGNMIINYLVGVFSNMYDMRAYPVILVITGSLTLLLSLITLGRIISKS